MERIESKTNGDLLHFVIRSSDFDCIEGRRDLIAPDNFLQCSMLNMNKGITFKPHKHIWHDGMKDSIAQESWVVIKGSVRAIYYDHDDEKIAEKILYAGDASFTLAGGHNYEIMEDGSKIFEFKSGPYFGQEKDKVFI